MGNASGLKVADWGLGGDFLGSVGGETDDDCVSRRPTLHRWSWHGEIAATDIQSGHTNPVHTGVRIGSGMESSYELSTNVHRICWGVSFSMTIMGPPQRGHNHWAGASVRSALRARSRGRSDRSCRQRGTRTARLRLVRNPKCRMRTKPRGSI